MRKIKTEFNTSSEQGNCVVCKFKLICFLYDAMQKIGLPKPYTITFDCELYERGE